MFTGQAHLRNLSRNNMARRWGGTAFRGQDFETTLQGREYLTQGFFRASAMGRTEFDVGDIRNPTRIFCAIEKLNFIRDRGHRNHLQ